MLQDIEDKTGKHFSTPLNFQSDVILISFSYSFHSVSCGLSFSQFSRQRYVLGDDAMKKLSRANVFIMGMDGLGIEIGNQRFLSLKSFEL